MKIVKFLFFTFITIIGISSFILLYNSLNKNEKELINIKNLTIISKYNEYLIAEDKEYKEAGKTYAVFKSHEYNYYEKLFTLPLGEPIESRFICWSDDNLYILGFNPEKINLSNGNIINKISLKALLNNTTGRMERILGNDGKYIYYSFSDNHGLYYAKIDFDLTNVTTILENEIPNNLK